MKIFCILLILVLVVYCLTCLGVWFASRNKPPRLNGRGGAGVSG